MSVGDIRTEQHLASIDRAVEAVREAHRVVREAYDAGREHRLFLALMELESRCHDAEQHLNDMQSEQHRARRDAQARAALLKQGGES